DGSLPPRRAPGRAGRGGLDAGRLPRAPPGDARRARRLRSRLPDVRRGHRPLLPRGAGRLGAVVRPRRRRRPRLRPRDRPPLPRPADALALARDPPFRPQAPGAAARVVSTEKYDPQAERWTETAYAA